MGDLRLTARRRPRISNLFFSLFLKLQSWRLAVVLSLVLAILSKIELWTYIKSDENLLLS